MKLRKRLKILVNLLKNKENVMVQRSLNILDQGQADSTIICEPAIHF